jgi:hypothetical protein
VVLKFFRSVYIGDLFNIKFSMSTNVINYLIQFALQYCRNLIWIFHSVTQRKYVIVSICDWHWKCVACLITNIYSIVYDVVNTLSNTTDAISGTLDACLSGAPMWTHVFSGVRVGRYLVFCVVFCRLYFVTLSFFPFVLSVIRITASDYPFCFFKIFFLDALKVWRWKKIRNKQERQENKKLIDIFCHVCATFYLKLYIIIQMSSHSLTEMLYIIT